MKVLVIGADGQLGTDLCSVIKKEELIPLTQNEIEITDMSSVRRSFTQYQPQIVINTAAFIRVDDCESELDTAYSVNAMGARNVAVQCENINAKLVHISTDYVFGGESEKQNIPYIEFDDPVPLSIYGKSKLAGENMVRSLCRKHMIVRSSGLFGVAGACGKGGNFVETMIRLGKEKNELKVVDDQIFSPTFTADLAEKIVEIMDTEYYGIFHITNSGNCSWYVFTREILRLTGIDTPVLPIKTDQYPQKALRPSYSVLDNYQCKLQGIKTLRDWHEAIKDYLGRKGHLHKGVN